MKLDATQKVTLCLGLGFLMYFFAHTVHKHNEASKKPAAEATALTSTATPSPEPLQVQPTAQPSPAIAPTSLPTPPLTGAAEIKVEEPKPQVEVVYEHGPPYVIAPQQRGMMAGEAPPQLQAVNIGVRNLTEKDIPDLRVVIKEVETSDGKRVNVPLRRLDDVPPYKIENVLRADGQVMMFGVIRMATGEDNATLFTSSGEIPDTTRLPMKTFETYTFEVVITGSGIQTYRKPVRVSCGRYGILRFSL